MTNPAGRRLSLIAMTASIGRELPTFNPAERRTVTIHVVDDLDRRQIDTAIEEANRRGRTKAAMSDDGGAAESPCGARR